MADDNDIMEMDIKIPLVLSEAVPKGELFVLDFSKMSFANPKPTPVVHYVSNNLEKAAYEAARQQVLEREKMLEAILTPTIPLSKAQPVQDEDGALTARGMKIAQQYATAWVHRGVRDLELEREYPDLEGFFYDIRVDAELAREHAEEG